MQAHGNSFEGYADLEGDNFLIIGGYESGIVRIILRTMAKRWYYSILTAHGTKKVQIQVLLCLLFHLNE